ncbi:hypothetical protein [Clostridium aminobutyricum]|uniref:Uncharacterized protein n=1 Tax=Clostridium aminobutyricum TaxID=33953 RepID=A0A939IHA8_CLOAM|nr:hypothetical protein [Clostridium aminobutyricum]MBN7773487.1 hypothetical protein [Clostridium aminobutyricum]
MNKQTSKWKQDFFTIWTGQAVSFITSAIFIEEMKEGFSCIEIRRINYSIRKG